MEATGSEATQLSDSDIAGGPGLRIGGLHAAPHDPAVMAVVNRSADSFYASTASTQDAVAACEQAAAQGATIVDIGGVRAGRGPEVGIDEEIDRVCPVIAAVHERLPELVISVDTYRHEVAAQALAAGAALLNDTWGGSDPQLAHVAAAHGAGLVCSHTGGLEPRTDAHRNHYGLTSQYTVAHVRAGLDSLAATAVAAGVARERILIDPTPDFGKNTHQSLALMRALPRLCADGFPVLLAISRKDFVGEAAGVTDPADRLPATIAATALAVDAGVSVVRAHDVEAMVQAIDTVLAIRGVRGPRTSVRGLI